MLQRFLSYPATMMVILGGAYVLAAVPPGQKMTVFAAIAAMSVGVSEIVLVGGQVMSRRATARAIAPRLALGAGALLLSYGSIAPGLLPNVLGGVLFAGGLLGIRA